MSDLEQIQLTINDHKVSVDKGATVYQAIKKLGVDVPVFCYQDKMPPFGACRVCLVEVEKMGKLQASCTLEASEGMVVKTHSKNALEGRQGILELLLINHPLDCPICDRGGSVRFKNTRCIMVLEPAVSSRRNVILKRRRP